MRFGIKELIFVLLMAGLVASSYIFVFKPAAEKRTGRERDIADRQKALADLKTATTGIGDLEKKIADLQQAIVFFESKLPLLVPATAREALANHPHQPVEARQDHDQRRRDAGADDHEHLL